MLHDDPLIEMELGGRLRERLSDCIIAQIMNSRVRYDPLDYGMHSSG